MFLDIGVNIALITITIFFLAVALVLLNLNKEFGRNKTQVYIIAALFIYELFSYILLGIDAGIYYGTDLYNNRIVSIIVGEFFNVFTTLVYYTLMVLLVLDRFLVFYLNIKYPLYCTTLNLLKVVISFVLLLFLTFILVAVLRVTELLQRRTHFWIFYTSFLILDLCYFLFVAFSYTYIFLVYQRQVKKNKQIVWREKGSIQITYTVVDNIVFSVIQYFTRFHSHYQKHMQFTNQYGTKFSFANTLSYWIFNGSCDLHSKLHMCC